MATFNQHHQKNPFAYLSYGPGAVDINTRPINIQSSIMWFFDKLCKTQPTFDDIVKSPQFNDPVVPQEKKWHIYACPLCCEDHIVSRKEFLHHYSRLQKMLGNIDDSVENNRSFYDQHLFFAVVTKTQRKKMGFVEFLAKRCLDSGNQLSDFRQHYPDNPIGYTPDYEIFMARVIGDMGKSYRKYKVSACLKHQNDNAHFPKDVETIYSYVCMTHPGRKHQIGEIHHLISPDMYEKLTGYARIVVEAYPNLVVPIDRKTKVEEGYLLAQEILSNYTAVSNPRFKKL